jgi:hypothetical protein
MAENKDFECIMKEITQGLTGNTKEDIKYLHEQGEKYKDHEYRKEILRACGRLMYDILPDDIKEIITNCPDYETRVKMIELVSITCSPGSFPGGHQSHH